MKEAASKSEAWGYEAVWAADRIIIPWEIKTTYPYSADQKFIVPPDRPFLEPLTCLAFLAGCTTKISLGISVLVLPYRHPLYWTKVVATIDQLSRGRFILGLGVGWMEEEFRALEVSFSDRGARSDEQLEILKELWEKDRSRFKGRFYSFDDVASNPKPYQRPRLPIWIGGEGLRAQRRVATYGDTWFPYFVTITPKELVARFDNIRRLARAAGREADSIRLACCLPVEVTSEPVPQVEGRLMGHPEQLVAALKGYEKAGVQHLSLQFMTPRWPDRLEQMERFAREVLPAF
ncbi:MAG: TIGR03619 family F420-dependent LLM class oxidoreductase [Deltaproteobacteria bacterium]|nr:TIGR03619 family F420-dependent LLM class oxidoreductase [Deltaproteobacteria bacterium]